ncbi:hypothetical protein GCM10009544_14380 [Streptomyces stramineus]|uniref:Transposase n=1 Tax=Streptomyces stramineus TaxID=173861 RepID=A0ABP3JHP3_9ACTN
MRAKDTAHRTAKKSGRRKTAAAPLSASEPSGSGPGSAIAQTMNSASAHIAVTVDAAVETVIAGRVHTL